MTTTRRTILMLLLTSAVAVCAAAGPIAGSIVFPSEPMTTVERTRIVVTVSARPGVAVEPWADAYSKALEGAGWTVVRTEVGAPSLAEDGSIAIRATYVLEPFLDGEYTVPGLDLVGRGSSGEATGGTLEGGSVVVESVLPEAEQNTDPLGVMAGADAGAEKNEADPTPADAPLGTLTPPPPVPEPGVGPVTIALLGVGLLAIAGLVRTVFVAGRRTVSARSEDPVARLDRLARVDAPDAGVLDEAHASLADAIRRADPIAVAQDAGLSGLLDRFERARYAPVEPSATERGRLIAEAARSARALPASSERGGSA